MLDKSQDHYSKHRDKKAAKKENEREEIDIKKGDPVVDHCKTCGKLLDRTRVNNFCAVCHDK